MALPWYRVHTVVLNDPGINCVHTQLCNCRLGWFNGFIRISRIWSVRSCFKPMWRQGMFVMPFDSSRYYWPWVVGVSLVKVYQTWSLEFWRCSIITYCFIRYVFLSCDLALGILGFRLFRDPRTGEPALDLPKNLWYSLILIRFTMLRFRCIPRNRLFGPGIWVSDAYGITGKYSQ
jgi:photosystem II CP47 chlorophyll apoprotein